MANGNGDKTKRRLVKEIETSPLRKGGPVMLETERKKAEEALQKGEKKYKLLFESTLDGMFVLDAETMKVMLANQAAADIYDLNSVEEAIGVNLLDLVPPEERGQVLRIIAKDMFENDLRQVNEFRTITKDGREIWISAVGTRTEYQGKIAGLVSFSDITERKQAEEELQAEKNKLRSVMDSVEDGLTLQDKDYNIIYQNEPLRENYGDRVGEKCYRLYEGRDKVCDGCPVKKAFNDGESHTAERKVVLPSGEEAFGEVTASPIRDAKGNIVSCLEIIRNITEHKQAEEELQAEKNKLQSVIGAMEDGLNIMDKDYNILYQNELPRRLFGEHIGEKCYRVYTGNKEVCDGCPVKKAFKDGKSHTSERKTLTPSGEVAFWETTANPIRDAGGKIISCLEIARDITERKQADEELQTEKNKLQSVVDALEYGITIQDRDYNIIYQNEQAKKPFGEHIGEKCYRVYAYNEDNEEVCDGCNVAKAFKDGKSHTGERRRVKPSGEVVFWENTASPVRDANGKITACLEITRDVTERKQAEEALADEATWHHILIDQSSDGIVILDEQGKVYEANRRFAEMLGYTPEETSELSVWDWEFQYPREQVAEMIASVGPEGDHFETRHRRKDGTIFDVEISTNGTVCAGRKLIFCVCRDITERKQAEEELQAEKNKLQSVIGAMEDALNIMDKDYNIIYQNELARRLYGDRLGEKCYRVYEGRGKVCDGCPIKKAFKDGKSHTSERKTLTLSGEVAFWETTANPIRDAGGEVISCLEIARDITERKQAEEVLKRTTEDLQLVNLINDAANRGYSLHKIIQLLARETKKIFSCYGVTFYEVSEDRKYLIMQNFTLPRTVARQIEKLIGGKVPQARIRLQEGSLYLKALQSGKPQLISDPKTIQRLIAECTENKLLKKLAPHIYKLLETGSVMQVPLVSEGEVIGLLDMSRKQPFTELELERFVPIAQQALRIIKRKRAKEKTRQQNEFLNNILDSLTYPFYVIDVKDYTIKLANPAAKAGDLSEKQTCYALTHKQAKPCRDVEHGCPLEEVKKTKKPVVVEHIHYDADGNARNIEVHGYPIFDTEGNVVQMIEYCLDITERKQAEEKLQLLSSVTQQVSDVTIVTDLGFNIKYVNKAAQDLFGYSAEEMLGKRMGNFNAEPLPKKLEQEIVQTVASGKLWVGTLEKRRKDGSTFLGECHISPLYDKQGQISSYIDALQDITERKQAEDALRESEARYRTVVEGTHDMIQSVGLDGSIIFVNKAWLDTLGYTEAELSSLNLFDIIHPDSQAHCQKMFAKVVSGKSIHGIEATFLTKDGRKILVEGNAAPRYIGDKVMASQGVFRDITERKQAEEARADEATRRRILIDQSLDGIVILDEDSKVLEANQRFAEMLGYTPEEVRELHTWDWDTQWTKEQLLEMGHKVDEAGLHLETYHRRKDGTTIDVDVSVNGAVCAGQKLIFCVSRDITARKQAEKTLLEAEEKYKNLVEAASDIIWEVDTQGRYTFVSPNIKDLLGYEVEEVVGKKRTLDFTPRQEVRKWLKRFKEVNAKRESFSGFELIHLHKNGTPVIFEISGIPFVDSDGNFKGYVGTNKDVTERKQMTEALRESQEFSTGLLENSPNPIFVLNPDTSVKYVNAAFEKLTGFKLAEIAGKKAPYPWWLKEESKAMVISLRKAMVSGGKKSEKVFHKKNGEPFWVALNSAPVVYRKKLLYFLISWLDITDRKRAEEEKADLEHKAHLASRLASVGEMASGIAHEINNPLTAVIGFAQLLMDNDLPEEIKEDLVIIHKEAQRAAGVARNLLTFARKHSPSKQPTNVNSIIEGVLTLRAYEQNVSNIKINAKLASDLPEVMADYSQLQQVFINLILNAEAAMLEASNGGTLTIITQKFNHSVRASFADDGPGIDKENLNRIFDPFFTTKEVGKGTGLGLSVCHGIIAEHGGKISARSKPGSGATFIVELPLSAHEQSKEPNEPA